MKDLYGLDFLPWRENVFRRADGNVHQVFGIPGQWESSYILMGAVGGDIFVLFGDNNTVVADPTAYSSALLVPNADSPDRIAEDTVSRFWIPRGVREGRAGKGNVTESRQVSHFGIVGSNADTEWFAYAITADKNT